MRRLTAVVPLVAAVFGIAGCGGASKASTPTSSSTTIANTTTTADISTTTDSNSPSTTVDLGTNPPGTPSDDEKNACVVWHTQLADQVTSALSAQDLAPLIRIEMGEPAGGGPVTPTAPWLIVSADAQDAGGLFGADFQTFDKAIIDAGPTDLSGIQSAESVFAHDCS